MPTVSIIVPVYDVEPYLCRCVDSILCQSFPDFEVILVDDGSPDRCPKICDEYARRDDRVRVIHQENKGLACARNAGMDIAEGKYILFCDSDDYVNPNWCRALLSGVCKEEDNFIFGRIHSLNQKDVSAPTEILKDREQDRDYAISSFLDMHIRGKAGFACNVLFYSSIIQDKHIRFHKDVIIEDLPFCLEYLEAINRLTYRHLACYFYIQQDKETLSRKYYQDGFRKWREKYSAIQQFIEGKLPQEEHERVYKMIADTYLYYFLQSLNNTFDSRNTKPFIQKLRYNQNVVRSEEFQHCLHYADGENENPWYLAILKQKKYYKAFVYVTVAKIKGRLIK